MPGRYQYVHNYVNHTFGSAVYENTSTHKVPCANCDGYLRQNHSDVTGLVCQNKLMHATVYNCCNKTLNTRHTATGVVARYTIGAHKITYSCCSGFATEAHTFGTGTVCTVCGAPKIESGVLKLKKIDPVIEPTYE